MSLPWLLLAGFGVLVAFVGVMGNWWVAAEAVRILEEQLQICGSCARCEEAKKAWKRNRSYRQRPF